MGSSSAAVGGCTNKVSADPNALLGPAGFGTPNFIQPAGNFSYTIDFENDGSAAAQVVTVTEQLDANLNWSTLQLGSFGFGPINVSIPAGLTDYQTTVAYQNTSGSSLNVRVALNFNVQTGLLTVTFTSLDPLSGAAPTGVFDGFLYPDNSSHVGEGFIQYTVQPKAGLGTASTISQQAAVVFDTNAPLNTATFVNTIDSGAPTSSVNPLPSASPTSFTVSWAGTDDTGGSGIGTFDVFVSDKGGAFTLWQTATTQHSAMYTGLVGHTYRFYSVATDNVGHRQATPTAAQAATTVFPSQGSELIVTGTSAADTFTFNGNTPTQFTFNGTTYTVDSTLVKVIEFNGQGSNDVAKLVGATAGGNTFHLAPQAALLTGTGFQVVVQNTPTILAYGGASDIAYLYDTSGANTLVSTPTYSYFKGTGFINYALNIKIVLAYAAAGSNDIAFLYDAATGANTLVAAPTYSDLSGTGYVNYAIGFKAVLAYATAGGNDLAYLYDSPTGANTLIAAPTYSDLIGTGFGNYALGFKIVVASATAGGNDTASLYGAATGANMLVAAPTYSSLTGAGFLNYAINFKTVLAHATPGGNDTAMMYGAATGANTFVSTPTYSYFTGSGYWNYALNFATVVANATAGGNDTASLYDSGGAGTFLGSKAYSSMSGTGFLNYAIGFETVHAIASSSNDVAYLYDSPENDTFFGQGATGTLFGTDYLVDATSFAQVDAISNQGGVDKVELETIDYFFQKFGNWQ